MSRLDPLGPFPDSDPCVASAAYLAELAKPAMVFHCQRTYRFALALGEKVGLRPDLEVLYISSLLHDLGLEPRFAQADGDFEDVGGRAAAEFLLARRAPSKLADAVREAIEVHTQVTTAEDPVAERALLHMGAMVDVVGMRLDQLPEATLREILERHPRLDCKDMLVEALSKQVELKPDSRIAAAFATFKLPDLIRAAPFEA